VVGWRFTHNVRPWAQRWNVLARPSRTGGHKVASLKEITQAALAAKRTISKEMLRRAIQEIPGVGETALAEIRAYRARFEQKD
jgi:hypothetical protein